MQGMQQRLLKILHNIMSHDGHMMSHDGHMMVTWSQLTSCGSSSSPFSTSWGDFPSPLDLKNSSTPYRPDSRQRKSCWASLLIGKQSAVKLMKVTQTCLSAPNRPSNEIHEAWHGSTTYIQYAQILHSITQLSFPKSSVICECKAPKCNIHNNHSYADWTKTSSVVADPSID